MKLLIVGKFGSENIENYYIKYIMDRNVEIIKFDLSDYYPKNIFKRLQMRLFTKWSFKKINKELLIKIKKLPPDIVWIFKGIEFYPETLKEIKGKGIKLVNYNPDHPFIRTSFSHGGKNVENSISYYDLYFSYSKDLITKVESEYKVRSVFLPFGYELSEDEFQIAINETEIKRVCFVGNPDKIRTKVIKNILNNGIAVDIYGKNWNKYIGKHPLLNYCGVATTDQLYRILRKYRIQLNIFRPHNINSHNMRSFEIPAVGGIQLAPQSNEHSDFFVENEEIFLYTNENDIINKISMILNLTTLQIAQVRVKAREKSVKGKYSYECRAGLVFDELERILIK